jgi:hypothetical protein
MALKAEQFSQLATAYESAAADPFVPSKQGAGFARKAEFYRLLAKLAAKKNASVQIGNSGSSDGANCPRSSADRIPLKRAEPLNKGKLSQTEPETSAHLQALMLLDVGWRLFRLASETFENHRVPNRQPPAARSEH